MSVACTSCGHAVPLGQFRCGKCGAAQSRDSIEDLDAPSELAFESVSEPGKDASGDQASEYAPRESIVPRGTFASDEPVADGTATTAKEKPSDPPAKSTSSATRTPSEGQEAVAAEAGSPSQPMPIQALPVGIPSAPVASAVSAASAQAPEPPLAQPAPRPPFLASEILREDLMPAEPGRGVLTLCLRVFGALGLLVAFWTYGSAPFALASVGSLAMLTVSALRLAHITRALAVATIAGTGLGVACIWHLALGGATEGALLAVSAPVLAGALFFRAWYRGSSAARGLVAVSLMSSVTWALMTANAKLLSLDWTVQSWLPALLWCVFVILCVLSLLAFMDDETTGACDVWATSLLVWYMVQAVTQEVLTSSGLPAERSLAALGLTVPIFAAPLAVAVAQLLARAFGRQHRLSQLLLRRNA